MTNTAAAMMPANAPIGRPSDVQALDEYVQRCKLGLVSKDGRWGHRPQLDNQRP